MQPNYLLLDAARMDFIIEDAKRRNPQHDSLYRGEGGQSLASVAPYLFRLDRQPEFTGWYIEQGWGDAWGVWVYSAYPEHVVYRHFRKFLLVRTEDGRELYFRFYDPRVLRIFLPTCDREQLREFFGPIGYFACEEEDGSAASVFSLRNGMLHQERRLKHTFISNNFSMV